MKKLLFLLLITVTPLVFNITSKAVSVTPNSGTVNAGSTSEITILAAPPSNSTAIQLRLTIAGATVIDYTPPTDSNITTLGLCNANDDEFTDTEICVDIFRSSGFFETGEEIGTMTLQYDATGTATVEADSDNGYLLESATLSFQSGNLATYNIGTGSVQATATPLPGTPTATPSTLPSTALSNSQLTAVGGFVIIMIGLAIFAISGTGRKNTI